MARKPGSRSRVVTKNARYRAWQTMRLFRKQGHAWSAPELAAAVETGIDNLRVYVKGLRRHRYLAEAGKERTGPTGLMQLWRLARDTGPLPPRLAVDGTLWDPNTGAEFPPPEQEATDGR